MSNPRTRLSSGLEEAARQIGEGRVVRDIDRRPALQIDYRDWTLTIDVSPFVDQVPAAWRLRSPLIQRSGIAWSFTAGPIQPLFIEIGQAVEPAGAWRIHDQLSAHSAGVVKRLATERPLIQRLLALDNVTLRLSEGAMGSQEYLPDSISELRLLTPAGNEDSVERLSAIVDLARDLLDLVWEIDWAPASAGERRERWLDAPGRPVVDRQMILWDLPRLRRSQVTQIALIEEPGLTGKVCELLTRPDVVLALWAAGALGRAGQTAAIPKLLRAAGEARRGGAGRLLEAIHAALTDLGAGDLLPALEAAERGDASGVATLRPAQRSWIRRALIDDLPEAGTQRWLGVMRTLACMGAVEIREPVEAWRRLHRWDREVQVTTREILDILNSLGQLPLVAEGEPDGRDLPRAEC